MANTKVDEAVIKIVKKRYEKGDNLKDICYEEGISRRTIERRAKSESWVKGHDNRAIADKVKAKIKRWYETSNRTIEDMQYESEISRETIFRWARDEKWTRHGAQC